MKTKTLIEQIFEELDKDSNILSEKYIQKIKTHIMNLVADAYERGQKDKK